MKRTFLPLVGAAVVGLTALGGAILLSAYATCPVREVSGAAPWFPPYHVGANPWAGAWAPSSDVARASSPPPSDRGNSYLYGGGSTHPAHACVTTPHEGPSGPS